jgi:WhiB family redox-sensing transcriptional regulator
MATSEMTSKTCATCRQRAARRRQELPRPSWGWQDSAACRGMDLVLFFGPEGERQPEREIRERDARNVCMGCPVRTSCLDYAVSRPEQYGTWGALNEEARSAERRRRMRRENAA